MSKCNTCINKKYCENHLDARTMCAKTDFVLFTPTYETNADRIRSMSDEELATWMNCMQSNAYHCGEFGRSNAAYPFDNKAWLKWLKEEVSE